MKLVRISCSTLTISLIIIIFLQSIIYIIFSIIPLKKSPIVVSESRADHSLSSKPGTVGSYDFFYFVQTWPAAYCDTKRGCCYPKTGKPAQDFGIHGLWPNSNNGSYPHDCDPRNPFDKSKIAGLIKRMQLDWPTLSCPSGDGFKFWGHEWNKHGTCSENVLNQQSYFQTTLDFKIKSNILHHLANAKIYPNDGFYKTVDVEAAIEKGLGVAPYIDCNYDKLGVNQLYEVYICVNKIAKAFVQCPVMPYAGRCATRIQFKTFV